AARTRREHPPPIPRRGLASRATAKRLENARRGLATRGSASRRAAAAPRRGICAPLRQRGCGGAGCASMGRGGSRRARPAALRPDDNPTSEPASEAVMHAPAGRGTGREGQRSGGLIALLGAVALGCAVALGSLAALPSAARADEAGEPDYEHEPGE